MNIDRVFGVHIELGNTRCLFVPIGIPFLNKHCTELSFNGVMTYWHIKHRWIWSFYMYITIIWCRHIYWYLLLSKTLYNYYYLTV